MTAYLPRLQVLRFVAAAMVLLGHVQHKVADVRGLDFEGFRQVGVSGFFAGGVDIFFVLSGFIMFTVAQHDFGRSGAASQFLLRRLARIVPSYWLFTSAMVFSMLIFEHQVTHNKVVLDHVIASYLFIPVANGYDEVAPPLILGWTLNFEMFFYAVFAAMLRWPRPLGLWLIVALVGTCGLIGFVAPPARAPLAFWCNPIVFEFLFGILLGRLHAAGWRLPPSLAWVLGLAAMVLLYLGALRSAPSPYWPQRCIFIGLPALAICACVALSREVPLSQGRVQGMLVRAGDASYALYLSHPFTLAAMAVVWPHAGPDSPWSFVVLASSACVLVSIAFHVGIEKPITGALNARIRRSRIGTRVPVGT